MSHVCIDLVWTMTSEKALLLKFFWLFQQLTLKTFFYTASYNFFYDKDSKHIDTKEIDNNSFFLKNDILGNALQLNDPIYKEVVNQFKKLIYFTKILQSELSHSVRIFNYAN